MAKRKKAASPAMMQGIVLAGGLISSLIATGILSLKNAIAQQQEAVEVNPAANVVIATTTPLSATATPIPPTNTLEPTPTEMVPVDAAVQVEATDVVPTVEPTVIFIPSATPEPTVVPTTIPQPTVAPVVEQPPMQPATGSRSS